MATIEEALVLIVREATLPSTQERYVAAAGIPVERAGYNVLRAVDEAGSLRLTTLARHLGLDASTVSRHVRALERVGLVSRSSDATDGRVTTVELTPAGHDALERLRGVRHRLFDEVLSSWSVDDRAALAPLLARLAHDLVAFGGRA